MRVCADIGARRAALIAPHADVALSLQLIESGSSHDAPLRFRDAQRGDATLLARCNAIRIEAGAPGGGEYRDAKARFIAGVLGA